MQHTSDTYLRTYRLPLPIHAFQEIFTQHIGFQLSISGGDTFVWCQRPVRDTVNQPEARHLHYSLHQKTAGFTDNHIQISEDNQSGCIVQVDLPDSTLRHHWFHFLGILLCLDVSTLIEVMGDPHKKQDHQQELERLRLCMQFVQRDRSRDRKINLPLSAQPFDSIRQQQVQRYLEEFGFI